MEDKIEDIKEKKEQEVKPDFSVKPKKKKFNIWPYISLVLLILLIVSLVFQFMPGGVTGMATLSTDEAGEQIMSFINEKLMQPGMEAELIGIEESNGIFEVELDVGGQVFTSYLTKDAEIFFPQGYVLSELAAELDGADVATGDAPATAEAVKSDVPNIKMFVMTFCPFGQQAEDGLGPALEVLGDYVEFEPHFVIYSDYASRMGASWDAFCWDEEEKYCSMHGIGELNEGVRQLCIYNDNPEKWWDYVNLINKQCSYQDVDECWAPIAETVGLDASEVEACFDEKGELLLKKELLLNQQFGVQGSPSVFINDASYSGGRAPENYKEGICNSFNEAPDACEETLSTTGAAATGDCG